MWSHCRAVAKNCSLGTNAVAQLTEIVAQRRAKRHPSGRYGFARMGVFWPAASHHVPTRRTSTYIAISEPGGTESGSSFGSLPQWPGSDAPASDALGGASSGQTQLPDQFTAPVSPMPLSRRTEIRFDEFTSTIIA